MSIPEYQDTGPITIPETISPTNLAGKSVIITGGISVQTCNFVSISNAEIRRQWSWESICSGFRRSWVCLYFTGVDTGDVELISSKCFRHYRRLEPGFWREGHSGVGSVRQDSDRNGRAFGSANVLFPIVKMLSSCKPMSSTGTSSSKPSKQPSRTRLVRVSTS